MKKLFIVLAVASLGFVACNNSSDSETKKDSTTNVIDSTVGAAKDAIDSTGNAAKDAIDSTGKAAKDTVKTKM